MHRSSRISSSADLHIFAINGDIGAILERILKKLGNSSKVTPKTVAQASNEEIEEVIALLIELGNDINGQDYVGNTALDYAIIRRENKIIEALKKFGAKINRYNDEEDSDGDEDSDDSDEDLDFNAWNTVYVKGTPYNYDDDDDDENPGAGGSSSSGSSSSSSGKSGSLSNINPSQNSGSSSSSSSSSSGSSSSSKQNSNLSSNKIEQDLLKEYGVVTILQEVAITSITAALLCGYSYANIEDYGSALLGIASSTNNLLGDVIGAIPNIMEIIQ